jgi:hypothetical protein
MLRGITHSTPCCSWIYIGSHPCVLLAIHTFVRAVRLPFALRAQHLYSSPTAAAASLPRYYCSCCCALVAVCWFVLLRTACSSMTARAQHQPCRFAAGAVLSLDLYWLAPLRSARHMRSLVRYCITLRCVTLHSVPLGSPNSSREEVPKGVKPIARSNYTRRQHGFPT